MNEVFLHTLFNFASVAFEKSASSLIQSNTAGFRQMFQFPPAVTLDHKGRTIRKVMGGGGGGTF